MGLTCEFFLNRNVQISKDRVHHNNIAKVRRRLFIIVPMLKCVADSNLSIAAAIRLATERFLLVARQIFAVFCRNTTAPDDNGDRWLLRNFEDVEFRNNQAMTFICFASPIINLLYLPPYRRLFSCSSNVIVISRNGSSD